MKSGVERWDLTNMLGSLPVVAAACSDIQNTALIEDRVLLEKCRVKVAVPEEQEDLVDIDQQTKV